jgi:hypothetical protein
MVFGGLGDESSSLEYLNGTAWVKQPLRYGRALHVMVVLPCP